MSNTTGRSSTSLTEAMVRVRAEYLEMPGLKLSADQAARLWSFEPALCNKVLEALVESRFLIRIRHHFVRA